MLTAITRPVTEAIADCELTFLPRQRIDVSKAIRQHREYEDRLRRLGVDVISLSTEPGLPDSPFVEDVAVVVDELAVMAVMGAINRRPEVHSIEGVLSRYRSPRYLNNSATLEGGDVVRVGNSLYVGMSRRTNREGVEGLRDALKPHGYRVKAVQVSACLHLSTGCSYIGSNTVLVNPDWVDISPFDGFDIINVPRSEPWAANTLVIGDTLIMADAYPETRELLLRRGFNVETLDISEFEKAEAGLTCLSLIFDSDRPNHVA
jgi:dimethylargininase